MSIQFGDILRHNNPNYPIADVTDVKGGLRSIATFSDASLISEYTSGASGSIIPEKYKSGYSLLLETSTDSIYYLSGSSATSSSDWRRIGVGGNGYGIPNTIPKWITPYVLGNSNITDNGDTIIISGNLMVIGTTSTVNSENLLVKDPIMLLAASQSGTPILDSGLFINRGTGATQAFIWDESEKEFIFISTTSGATTSGDVSIGTYSNVRTGALKVDSILIADGTQGPGKLLISDTNGLASWTSSSYLTASSLIPYLTTASASTPFYKKGGLTYSFDTTSSIYRTGSLSIGTGSIDSNDRFVVSSSTGTVSLVVDENGYVYNRGRGGTATNTAFGFMTLGVNTTGNRNTAFGASALSLNTIGSFNTAIGQQSLMSNLSGQYNNGLGHQSLNQNTTGQYNNGVGANSLRYNISGSSNVGIGYNSLYYNLVGNNNTAVGFQSLQSNSTVITTFGTITPGSGYATATYSGVQLIYATGSTALGYGKVTIVVDGTGGVVSVTETTPGFGFIDNTTRMTASFSTGTGFEIGISASTSGISNTAIGYNSLGANTAGSYNTGIGYTSLQSNTTGNFNVGVGYNALSGNKTGVENVAVGYGALSGNSTGNNNIAIGKSALLYNSTGESNIGIGWQALPRNTVSSGSIGIGRNTLFYSKTGSLNTAIGEAALYFNTLGSNNTALGCQAGFFSSTGISTLGTFSGGNSYNPGTYSGVQLGRLSGSGTDGVPSDYPLATIVVGTGGTVSSVTLETTGRTFATSSIIMTSTASVIGGGTGFTVRIDAIQSAEGNTSIGWNSFYYNTIGSNNTALGLHAGSYTSIAPNFNYISDNSVFLGYFARAKNSNETNQIVIGYDAYGNGSNTVTLGNDNIEKTILKGNVAVGFIGTSVTPSCDLEVKGNQTFTLPDTDSKTSGDVVYFGNVTTGLTPGSIYYYDSSGYWILANASLEATSSRLLAIALGTSSSDGMLLRGFSRFNNTLYNAMTLGSVQFLSITDGEFQETQPVSSGQVVRVIGYCTDTNMLYFCPDTTWIELL